MLKMYIKHHQPIRTYKADVIILWFLRPRKSNFGRSQESPGLMKTQGMYSFSREVGKLPCTLAEDLMATMPCL